MLSSKKELLVIALLGIILGCSNSSAPTPAPEPTIHNLFPLHIGNLWMIQEKVYDDSTGLLVKIDTSGIRIDDTVEFNNIPAFKGVIGDDHTTFFTVGNTLYFSKYDGLIVRLAIRYPMNIDEAEKIFDTTIDNYTRRSFLRLVSKNESVTVPAGTFSTVHYQEVDVEGAAEPFDTTSINDQYFSPGIGVIKLTSSRASSSSILRLSDETDLISYSLKYY